MAFTRDHGIGRIPLSLLLPWGILVRCWGALSSWIAKYAQVFSQHLKHLPLFTQTEITRWMSQTTCKSIAGTSRQSVATNLTQTKTKADPNCYGTINSCIIITPEQRSLQALILQLMTSHYVNVNGCHAQSTNSKRTLVAMARVQIVTTTKASCCDKTKNRVCPERRKMVTDK